MVYDDLIIRNNTVSYYNTNRSQTVTVRCINTEVGAPVDRRRLTGMICPNRTLISVRIIVPFFRMASSPVTILPQLILNIYMAGRMLNPGTSGDTLNMLPSAGIS